jgi:hypothetical protein
MSQQGTKGPSSRAAPGERSLDVAAALREAKMRGLPSGWKVSIDVSRISLIKNSYGNPFVGTYESYNGSILTHYVIHPLET